MSATQTGGFPPRGRGRPLSKLLECQYGVISLSQAQQLGLTMSTVRYRIKPGGPWQRIFPGVYLTVSGTPTSDQRDMAALLYVGNGGTLTGLAALRRLGVEQRRNQLVDVLAPTACGRESRGYVRIQRTSRLPRYVLVDGEIQFVTAPRAVIDAVRRMPALGDIRATIAGAVQQRACTVQQVEAELVKGKLRNAAIVRAVLAEVMAGMRSSPEGDFMDLVKGGGLPTPLYNPRLYVDGKYLARPDAWWPEASVAVEVDSREWHFSPEDWEQTMLRHDRMAAAGIRVLHFTPKQIRTQPDMIIATITQALAVGAPSPRIQTKPAC